MKTILLVLGLAALCLSGARAATFTVTTAADDGPGSLRQAILDANAAPDADVIGFNIDGAGPHIIAPATRLPDITASVAIDGFTQPGASPNTLPAGNNAALRIQLDGATAFGATGLRLRAPNCQVRGLSITRFAGEGIQISGATGCVVAGNYIGLAPNGTAQPNRGNGLQIFNSANNRAGGTAPADRNVLSGNFSAGVHLVGAGASNNVVEGNFIGTSPDGSAARANFVNGVHVQDAPRNRIGGATPGARNVISGNTPAGVSISGSESVENVLLGNFIGPSASGAAGLGSQGGVNIEGGATNRLGGSAAGEGNVIAGNSGYGVRIDFSSTGNVALGNRIGVGPTGGALANGAQGFLIRGSGNRIGGTAPGEGNEIANNAPGIEAELGAGNAIRGNSIRDNRPRFAGFGGLGIDLAPFGVTANDAGDGDSGVNLLQNFPVLTAASASGAGARVQGALNSRPNAAFALDFFSNADCDPSGNGEGAKYLGSANVTTDAGGAASFDVTLAVAAEGRQFTATATDADGNTSEFSPCFAASVAEPPRTFVVTNTNDSGPGSLRQALLDAQANPASANNIVAFNISGLAEPPEGGTASAIRLTTPLAPIFEGVTIDGFTQPGASANTLADGNNAVWLVRLDGAQLGANADGLTIGAPGCEVRGLELAGFRGAGIRVAAEGDSSLIEGCHLLNNQSGGVLIDNASNVTVGGTLAADRNVIHANGAGIQISGAGAMENLVLGNWIGLDPAGAGGSGNFGEGVLIQAAGNNRIGGAAAGEGNRIAFNRRTGVSVLGGMGNDILGNRIDNNVGLGIDLFPGANGDLAAPTVSSATIRADGLDFAGTFRGAPNTLYTLQAFSSLTANAGGEFFLGSVAAATDGAGAANFSVATGGNFIGRHLTVTATGPSEGTSEFSAAFTPNSVRPPGAFTVTTAADEGPGSLRQALIDAGDFLANGNNIIAFNIPGPGVKLIQPLTPFILPDGSVTIDGFTQPGSKPNTQTDEGYDGVHLIQIDGARQRGGTAFSLAAQGSVLRGLSVTRFRKGIELGGAGGHLLQGNLIGVDPFFRPAGNTDEGVEITSPNNRVGGTISADGDELGRAAVALHGARAGDGPSPAHRNVIGANVGNGIVVITPQAGFNEFHGNLIGFLREGRPPTDRIRDLGNGEDGIQFRFNASDNRVGGPLAQHKNFFAFNRGSAVNVESGNLNAIFNMEHILKSPFASQRTVTVARNANDNIQPPTITFAHSDNLSLRVGLRYTGKPNTPHEGEIYVGDRVAGGSFDTRKFTLKHAFNFTTDALGNASREEVIAGSYEQYARGFATVRDADGNTSAASDLVKVIRADSADVKTLFFAPPQATNGVPFDLTVVVTNCGPATATNVVVEQVLASLQLVALTAPGKHNSTNNTFRYPVGDLPPGQARTFTATVRPNQTGTIQLSAESSHDGPDSNRVNDKEAVATRVVPTQGPRADLQAGIVVPERALAPGELATFTFLVTNTGPAAATGVRMAIELPRGAMIESVDTVPAANCEVTGNVVSCARDALAQDQVVAVTVRARLAGTDSDAKRFFQGLSLTAWAATVDPDPFNNSASESVEILTRLAISQNETALDVTWPAPSPGVELQFTTNLAPPIVWVDVSTNLIVTVNGTNKFTLFPQAAGSPAAQFFWLAPAPPAEPQAEFDQVSMALDGVQLAFTDWCQVTFTLPLSEDLRYVNVSFNNNWVIQNIPILSGLSGGVADTICMSFPLRTNGAPVFTAKTGFTVTKTLADAPPPSTDDTFLGTEVRVHASGEQGVRLTYAPAEPLVGGRALQTAQAKPGFPNPEQRPGESVPSAIFNALAYLNSVFGLNVPQADIDLATIKVATGWTPGIGAPIGDDLMNPDWVQAEQQHLRDRNIPIVTELTTDVSSAMAALRAMYGVKIRLPGHAASVIGIVELGGVRYSLTLAHDQDQAEDGGNAPEIVTLDANTGQVAGTGWGNEFVQFIIQRPER